SRLLRDILSSFILAALGDFLAGDRRELRAALIGSHIGGLMLARYILEVPGVAAASPEDLVQAVGPGIQHYLTAAIAPRERPLEAFLRGRGVTAVDDDRLAGDERVRGDQREDRLRYVLFGDIPLHRRPGGAAFHQALVVVAQRPLHPLARDPAW